MSQVISFRASGHFLNWLESQRIEGESVSQCCQRMLKDISAGVSTNVSTQNTVNVASTDLSTPFADLSTRSNNNVASTNTVDIVDKAVNSKFNPVIERMAAIEERLGKLRA
ncbi:hypothetical protein QUB60_29560 [Microcoleus sp. A2-C5]|uniref:hypothetical protein n=1 Tax=unclassified Microcoleus TaxID=2642155 RepID=UPI002FD2609B